MSKKKKLLHVGAAKNEPCMFIHLFFFHKVLQDFLVKNPISSFKKLKTSNHIQVVSNVMTFYLQFCVFTWIEKFILFWIFS